MEDRYLYKAKRKDNGEWVVGNLITNVFFRLGQSIPYILCPDKADYDCFEDFSEENGIFEVRPDTICQYTGLRDKNGKLIWEHDVVERLDIRKVGEPTVGVIEYDIENTAFIIHWLDKPNYSATFPWKEKIQVTGNKFDNPELLESEC